MKTQTSVGGCIHDLWPFPNLRTLPTQGLVTFSFKVQVSKYFRLYGAYTVSAPITQLCY